MTTNQTQTNLDLLSQRLKDLRLWGLWTHFDEIKTCDWLPRVLDYEEKERTQRGLKRRLKNATLGSFKSMADFDWKWPKKIDRKMTEDFIGLDFLSEGVNPLVIGPNGIGKTMIAKNIAYQAAIKGYTARFITASDMLNDLAAQDTAMSLSRRLKRYCRPDLLCIDEVGYLSYDSRYADLLFEVVTRRYNDKHSIVLTTNKPFAQWPEVFPNAGCVVTLVDRLIHRSEILTLEGKSYRLFEAQNRAKSRKQKSVGKKSTKSKSST